MARASQEEKDYRKSLAQHLWHFHGEFKIEAGTNLSLDELEQVHRMMHIDRYGCPPHDHNEPGTYDLGEVKLTLGKKYTQKLVEAIRGDDR